METHSGIYQVALADQAPFDVIGVWQGHVANTLLDGAGAFWQVDLPDDLGQAQEILHVQSMALEQGQQALTQVAPHLQTDLAGLQSGGRSFGLPGVAMTGSGRILAAAMGYSSPKNGAAFNLLDDLRIDPAALESAMQAVAQFLTQVERTISQFALVETRLGGRLLGRTRVDWLGGYETWWQAGDALDVSDHFGLHTQVVDQAILTRQNWLKFALLLTTGMVRIGASLATGPFSLVTIWASWNYVRSVVKEIGRLNRQPVM